MRYLELTPSIPLQPFVASLWSLEGSGDPGAGAQPVFPDGRSELIVHYGDPFSHVRATETVRQPHGFIVGQIEQAMQLQEGRRVGVLAARLRPAAVGALFGTCASEVTGRVVEVSDLAGAAGRRLVDAVNLASTHGERIAALENFLLSRISRARLLDPRIEAAADLIQQSGGEARIADVAYAAALSARHFQRRFIERVGLAPKQYARIVRFQRALGRLQTGASLTEAAVSCGYHDHPHFAREFSGFAGVPPSRFVRDPARLSEHFIQHSV